MYTLEIVIFYLTRLDGGGFASPGSFFKDKCRHQDGKVKVALSDEDVQTIRSSGFALEWKIATGKKPGAVDLRRLQKRESRKVYKTTVTGRKDG